MTNSHLSSLSPKPPINVDLLEFYLLNHPDRSFVSFLCDGLRYGFKIGYDGPRHPISSSNLISANQHQEIIESNLLDEVVQGHTAGPFTNSPYENFRIFPIDHVPKNPKGSGHSVNDHIPQENFSLQYIRLDDAIKIVQELGRGCYMAKTDIKSAFRNIPIHPDDWKLLGMKWKDMFFFDMVLPFGLRSAPYLFNLLLDALEWILNNLFNVPRVLHILDDFFIAEPAPFLPMRDLPMQTALSFHRPRCPPST